MGRRFKGASYSPARNPDLVVLRCSDGPREAWRATGVEELETSCSDEDGAGPGGLL